MHETVIPYFHEPCGKHMLEESSDKFNGIKFHGMLTVTVCFLLAEIYISVFHFDDAII